MVSSCPKLGSDIQPVVNNVWRQSDTMITNYLHNTVDTCRHLLSTGGYTMHLSTRPSDGGGRYVQCYSTGGSRRKLFVSFTLVHDYCAASHLFSHRKTRLSFAGSSCDYGLLWHYNLNQVCFT